MASNTELLEDDAAYAINVLLQSHGNCMLLRHMIPKSLLSEHPLEKHFENEHELEKFLTKRDEFDLSNGVVSNKCDFKQGSNIPKIIHPGKGFISKLEADYGFINVPDKEVNISVYFNAKALSFLKESGKLQKSLHVGMEVQFTAVFREEERKTRKYRAYQLWHVDQEVPKKCQKYVDQIERRDVMAAETQAKKISKRLKESAQRSQKGSPILQEKPLEVILVGKENDTSNKVIKLCNFEGTVERVLMDIARISSDSTGKTTVEDKDFFVHMKPVTLEIEPFKKVVKAGDAIHFDALKIYDKAGRCFTHVTLAWIGDKPPIANDKNVLDIIDENSVELDSHVLDELKTLKDQVHEAVDMEVVDESDEDEDAIVNDFDSLQSKDVKHPPKFLSYVEDDISSDDMEIQSPIKQTNKKICSSQSSIDSFPETAERKNESDDLCSETSGLSVNTHEREFQLDGDALQKYSDVIFETLKIKDINPEVNLRKIADMIAISVEKRLQNYGKST